MPAIPSLRRLQAAIETTRGTHAPATRVLRGSPKFSEQRTTYRSEYPAGVRATVGGVGVVVQRATTIDVETELTTEEVLWPLTCGLRTVTPTGTGPYTWTFEPALTADDSTISTMSLEYADSDGVTNHYLGGAEYVVVGKIGISAAPGEVAKLTWSGFGRARSATTPAAGAAPYAARTMIPGGLWSVYWDSTWAGLGGTLLSGVIRSAEVEIETGWQPDYLLDNRANLDFSALRPGPVTVSAKLSMELNAVAAARISAWRANSPAFVRLIGAANANNSVQIDLSARLGDDLTLGEGDGVVTCDMSLEGVYDETSQKLLVVTVKNGIGAL